MNDAQALYFLDPKVVEMAHDEQLAEHGGLAGLKDRGLLESALARLVNKHGYGEDDHCALAAAYAFGIARNHPFADGNKRTAWVAACTFLQINAVSIAFEQQDAIDTMISLASGMLSEDALAEWFRAHRIDI